jgi:hypothetical protein
MRIKNPHDKDIIMSIGLCVWVVYKLIFEGNNSIKSRERSKSGAYYIRLHFTKVRKAKCTSGHQSVRQNMACDRMYMYIERNLFGRL